MSRTSLGQRHDQQRPLNSKMKQVVSVVRTSGPQDVMHERVLNLQEQEAKFFKFQKDKYDRTEMETKYLNCEPGECLNYVKDDFGKYIFENGDEYMGEWKNQKMHGNGKYTFGDPRRMYLGQFANGLFHGFGYFTENQGGTWYIIYQGVWEEGVKHGQGTHYYQGGLVRYFGQWKNNRKEGFGTVNLLGGQYQGQWMGDQRHGQGKLVKQDRGITMIYEGNWDNDELHEGTVSYQQNDYGSTTKGSFLGKYQGHFRSGKKHGWGHYYWPANQKRQQIQYDGQFNDDRVCGKGRIIIGKFSFQGQFSAQDDTFGGPEVKGIITYENGDRFQGVISIADGKVHRQKGSYLFSNGDRADGQFHDNENGEIIGKFLYEWADGKSRQF